MSAGSWCRCRRRADVEDTTIDEAERARRVAANGAAARLLALPWELLRGPRGFLFEGAHPIRVVRRGAA